ncbi:MAG: regulatory protein [Pseudohongiellaceae bacterium]|jgi:regulatory protein
MDFLARREHSFYELQQKLLRKFPDVEHGRVDSVIARLRDESLQSDERFVEAYVRYRRNRGFGNLHIKSDLASRRVDESLIDSYLIEDDSWDEMVQLLIAKKLAGVQTLEYGSKPHRKLVNFLHSRGFTHDQVRKGLIPWLVSAY